MLTPLRVSQPQLEKLIEKNYYLYRSARDGYRSYIMAYASHSLKHIFDVHTLDMLAVSKAFGFTVPPKVNLALKASGSSTKRQGLDAFGSRMGKPSGKYSVAKSAADKRQFAR